MLLALALIIHKLLQLKRSPIEAVGQGTLSGLNGGTVDSDSDEAS